MQTHAGRSNVQWRKIAERYQPDAELHRERWSGTRCARSACSNPIARVPTAMNSSQTSAHWMQ